jgi:uncharacterized protein with HEPN domain
MQRKIAKYLFDIDDCITAINNSVGQDKSYNDYVNNRQLRRSIERELDII